MRAEAAVVARVAVISDIHGNQPALEAVLAEIERERPDLIVVGGDVASGPMPAECIERLMALGERACFLRGNADREVVARFDDPSAAAGAGADPAAQSADWAAGQINRSQRDFLASFPETISLEIDGLGAVLFCHGSPRSDEEIITAISPESRLRPMLAGVTESVVVCGHTHVQFDRTVAGKRVVNAGSVGMPYEGQPGAYWAMLGPDVTLRRTEYDFERAAARIRTSGYPDAEEFARENVLHPPSAEDATAFFEQLAEQPATGG